MTRATFLRQLGLTTALAVLVGAACHWLLPIDYAWPFSLLTLVAFLLFTLVLYYFADRTAAATNKLLFGNVFLGGTLVKMMLCGVLVVGYALLGQPLNKLFVVPFFLLYFVYTAFEVVFLLRLAART